MSVGLIPPTNPAASAGMQLIAKYVASGSASLDCAVRNQGGYSGNLFQTDFDVYVIKFISLIPSTNAVDTYIRVTTNGGVSYDNTAIYATALAGWANAGLVNAGNAYGAPAAQFVIRAAGTTTNTGVGSVTGTLEFIDPLNAATYKQASADFITNSGTDTVVLKDGYIYKSATPVNGFQAFPSAGTWVSGYIAVYAVPKSASVVGANVLAGTVVQKVSTQTATFATGTTIIPFDNTIPQNTEGDQYMSLAITPKSATNKLQIDVIIWGTHSAGTAWIIAALFQDAIANALDTKAILSLTATAGGFIKLTYTMVAGTTSATTFKVRMGGSTAGTTTFCGQAGAGLFGGTLFSSIVIEEIAV